MRKSLFGLGRGDNGVRKGHNPWRAGEFSVRETNWHTPDPQSDDRRDPTNGAKGQSSFCFASCSPTALLEQIDFLPAVRTAQPAHVLDDAEDRGLYLRKSSALRTSAREISCGVVTTIHPASGDGIQHGQMFITRAGRESMTR